MKHYVYYSYEEWGRGYLGVRSCDCDVELDSNYLGSYRDKDFCPTQKIVVAEFETRKEAVAAEILLHDFFDVAVNPKFANLSKATSTGFDKTGVKASKDTLLRMREAQLGKKHTEKTRQKLSEVHIGKTHTEETKKKMSESHTGRIFTEEHKRNISKVRTGVKRPELSEKLAGENNPSFGKKWYVNENGDSCLSHTLPGTGWRLGRKIKSNSFEQNK
jgi:hypothetical protein